LRTALLSALEPADGGGLRAELSLAGRSVLSWQASLALELGCERILCLCDAPNPAILACQREIEAGAQFHAVRSLHQLVALCRAGDMALVLADGLLPEPSVVAVLVEAEDRWRRGIWTVPVEHPAIADRADTFERIDASRRWAGLSVVGAEIVARIADGPADGDALAILLRLGLQAKIACRPLPEEVLSQGQWQVAARAANIEAREVQLVRTALPMPPFAAPLRALATLAARSIGAANAARGRVLASLVGIAALVLGAVLIAWQQTAAGLAFAAAKLFAADIAEACERLQARIWSAGEAVRWTRVRMLGGASVAAALLCFALVQEGALDARLALPLLMLGLAHLASVKAGSAAAFWNDRATHFLLFALAASFGALAEALALLGLGALTSILLKGYRR
jgi:hypothetical protein